MYVYDKGDIASRWYTLLYHTQMILSHTVFSFHYLAYCILASPETTTLFKLLFLKILMTLVDYFGAVRA